MSSETVGLVALGGIAVVSLISLIVYLRSRPIDLIDPTTGRRELPEALEGDVPPDLPASAWRRFPWRWPQGPRWR